MTDSFSDLHCPQGHPVSADSKFCSTCGAPIAPRWTAAGPTFQPPRPVQTWGPTAPNTAAPTAPNIVPRSSRGLFVGLGAGAAAVAAAVALAVGFHVFPIHRTPAAASGDTPSAAAPASPSDSSSTPSPTTESVSGTLVLSDYDTAENDCIGSGGYSDIEPGTQVLLTNESGTIIGSAALEIDETADNSTSCTYTFDFADVPPTEQQYAVEVSHRGKIVMSEADLVADGWVFALTLGS